MSKERMTANQKVEITLKVTPNMSIKEKSPFSQLKDARIPLSQVEDVIMKYVEQLQIHIDKQFHDSYSLIDDSGRAPR